MNELQNTKLNQCDTNCITSSCSPTNGKCSQCTTGWYPQTGNERVCVECKTISEQCTACNPKQQECTSCIAEYYVKEGTCSKCLIDTQTNVSNVH